MVFGFNRKATTSNASLKLAPARVAENLSIYVMGNSQIEGLLGRHGTELYTVKWANKTFKSKDGVYDEPRLTLLGMIASDLPTLLALRRTSKAMKQFVEEAVIKQLQKKFETFEIGYPPQIQQGPSILTTQEGLNWIGGYVKKLKVTVIPQRTIANLFQSVQDIKTREDNLHEMAQREFFPKSIATSGYGQSFETILRSVPFLQHLEIILAPVQTTMFDRNGLQIETTFYSPETWHWCPLFDEWPTPGNVKGKSAVTHLSPLMNIRIGLDEWCPVHLEKLTLTNLTFSGFLALYHDALGDMRVTKDAVFTIQMDPVETFWRSLRSTEISMVAFWELEDMPSDQRVKVGSKEYKFGLNLMSSWMGTNKCRKLTWLKPELTAQRDQKNVASPVKFVPAKGPSRFRFWFLFW
ncbi:hypothetical protein MMC18_002679 [Xylographa bjoerkii]|nr:hypothetical protein [Xylographa bjoerkii]